MATLGGYHFILALRGNTNLNQFFGQLIYFTSSATISHSRGV